MRVCAAQYLMRKLSTWEEFEASIRFLAEVADEYHGHFLLLPEWMTAVLLQLLEKGADNPEGFRSLAEWTPRYVELLKQLAQEHNLYIVGGSAPMVKDGETYNVAFLVTPSGHVYEQEKLHITPSERETWGVRPGREVSVFDTPFGRIGLVVCYDVEFPELIRLMALAGVEVLFVPFSTDEAKAYQRVRYSAAARAVENGMYTVIAGSAGNLPTRNYMLNYARSAVLTPSDFGFPDDAVIAEADPNVETVVVADLDLTALQQFHQDGSVRPMRDRRPDLYELKMKVPIKVIRAE
jgi:predicted amidohydrolase